MADRMQAGKRRDRLAFEEPVESADGMGGTKKGYAERFRRWAHIRYLRGGEDVMAARLSGRQPVLITLKKGPFTDQLHSGWRIRDVNRGTLYNIRTEPTLSENRLFVEVLAESGVAS